MREATLRDFLIGKASAVEPSADIEGASSVGPDEATVEIYDEVGEFKLTNAHLRMILDAVLAGSLEPWTLEPIGSCIVASEFFSCHRDTPERVRAGVVQR
jgi:hypothetical protein